MIVVWSMLALALAVSLDGFSAGMLYGVRGIRVPWPSVAIVAACSGFVLFGSMEVGFLFVEQLPERAAQWIGASILIVIGAVAIVQLAVAERGGSGSPADDSGAAPSPTPSETASAAQTVEPASAPSAAPSQERTLLHWEIRQLGLIVHIWRTPSMADVDRSGVISPPEALLLGIALSLDSLGAGVGAALVGFPPVWTALFIGLASGLCIAAGARLGRWCSGWRWVGKLAVLPGCILIGMGIMKLL